MLAALEQQVRAVVAKAVPGDTDLTVALQDVGPGDGFDGEQHAIVPVSESSVGRRRILPVTFTVRIAVRRRPAEETANARLAARTRLLEDISRIAYHLGDAKIRTGKAFVSEEDRGFDVASLLLIDAKANGQEDDGVLAGELRYRGTGTIWPPEILKPEGEILDIELAVAAEENP